MQPQMSCVLECKFGVDGRQRRGEGEGRVWTRRAMLLSPAACRGIGWADMQQGSGAADGERRGEDRRSQLRPASADSFGLHPWPAEHTTRNSRQYTRRGFLSLNCAPSPSCSERTAQTANDGQPGLQKGDGGGRHNTRTRRFKARAEAKSRACGSEAVLRAPLALSRRP